MKTVIFLLGVLFACALALATAVDQKAFKEAAAHHARVVEGGTPAR
jgi:hypothetical protein